MAVQLNLNPSRALDANAWPVAAATATFYQSGTSTLATTYTTAALSVANPNPLSADASGVFPTAFVSGTVNMKVVIKDAIGNILQTIDPAHMSAATAQSAADMAFSPITGNASTNVQAAIGVNTARLQTYTPVGEAFLTQATILAQRGYLSVPRASTNIQTGNLDALTETGFYRLGPSVTNGWAGVANGDALLSLQWSADESIQWGFDQSGADTPLWFRTKVAGAWGAWASVYSSARVDALIARSYTSPAQTVTAAGTITLAHGLGAIPTRIHAWLKCKIAEEGYSIDDIVRIDIGAGYTSGGGMNIVTTATDLVIRFGSGGTFPICNKTTGVIGLTTAAKWDLYVKALP